MNSDFRTRVLLPFLLPPLLVAGFIGFAFALSRVLLAVPRAGSNIIALFLAAYLLGVAGLVAARERISSKALGIALAVGLLAIGVSGVLAAQAGMRDFHAEEEGHGAAGEGEDGEGEPAEGAALPEGAHVFVAEDIAWAAAPDTIPAGEAIIAIDNTGGIVHNVVFEGTDVLVEAQGGESASDTFALEPGTYTYFCNVPGHRQAGMEGSVTVE